MWRFLGLVVFCSLAGPLQGQGEKSSPAILCAVSPTAILKFVSTFCLRNGLLQSHMLALQFPDIQPKGKQPEHWIKDLHIVKVFAPSVTVELQGKTADAIVCVQVRLHLSATFFSGKHHESIDIIVDVDIKSRNKPVDFFMGTFSLKYESCNVEFKIAKIVCPVKSSATEGQFGLAFHKALNALVLLYLPSNEDFASFQRLLLVNQVRPVVAEVLTTTFPKALCRVVELVIRLVSIDFQYTANVLLSIGSTTTVHYRIGILPLITSSAVALELKVLIRTGGRIITVPISSAPVPVPVLRTHALCLGITQASLHVFLSILVRIQPQEFICTPEVFSGAVELTDAIAVLLSNQKCPKCATKSPLKITITVVSVPVITLEPKRTIIDISVEIGIFAKGPSGAISGLFVMRANLKLSVQISVHDCKLILSTQLTSLELILVSSEVGPIDVSVLGKAIRALLVETLMPRVNDCLSVGVPLPSLLHLKMAYPAIEVSQTVQSGREETDVGPMGLGRDAPMVLVALVVQLQVL
ncbi:hypothetical protein lerEdw1_005029 [Lerista edwardsae]|nr:hypothetical protein lerEdw1_005029 [Lerista edwardsae]